MGFDRSAPKRPVNMSLNEDLVRRTRELTANLSETVEALLAEYLEHRELEACRRERQIAEHIAASNAFTSAHGTLADEFSTI